MTRRVAIIDFQYPLRAYRVWNLHQTSIARTFATFQYPLRAYRVWNVRNERSIMPLLRLSVPSAGL